MMRGRIILIVVAVTGLLLASTAPAGGAAAVKTEYWGYECFVADFTEAETWQVGKTFHARGVQGSSFEYVWDGDSWDMVGTNSTTINFNEGPNGSSEWGTFDIDLEGIGHFAGTWSGDKARGTEVDGKSLAKVDLAPDTDEWDADEFPEECPAYPRYDFGDFVFPLPPQPVSFVIFEK